MSKKNGSLVKKSGTEPPAGPEAVKNLPSAPEHWSEKPEEHDFPAAAAYLSLVCDPTDVRKLVSALRTSPTVQHQAKDLLRASGLALLPTDNAHVASDLAKIDRGQKLSPVLLIRGDFRRGAPLTIADGYHRVCASYHLDENADIPCHLVDYKPAPVVPGFRFGSVSTEGQ